MKSKTITEYLAGLQSLRLNCTLDKTELEVYSHPVLQKFIAGFQKLSGERDIYKHRPITCTILLRLISRFDQTTEGASLQAVFYFTFAGFLRIREFTFDKVECDFNSWKLTRSSISVSENWHFVSSPSLQDNLFRRGVILTISAATDKACEIKFLCNLFEQFPKAHYHTLFSTSAGTFSCNYITKKLKKGIHILVYKGNYTGHSFAGEVQHWQN